MSFQIVSGTLSAAVADDGTFTASYPSGTNEGTFYKGVGHKLVIGQNAALSYPIDFDVTLGTSSITITNKTGSAWPDESAYRLQLEEPGKRAYRDDMTRNLLKRTYQAPAFLINLGAPDTADADGVSVSQTPAAGGEQELTITGAAASSSVATFDVPRNVTVTSAGDETGRTFTVTGTDEYGNAVVEAITGANAGAAAGKKAFKTVTSVAVDDDTAGAVTVGFGDVLGLPVFLPAAGFILKELQDGAAATAGTTVAGVVTAGGATATTGDVRGTYDPNAACDGDKVFQLVVALADPGHVGQAQYAG